MIGKLRPEPVPCLVIRSPVYMELFNSTGGPSCSCYIAMSKIAVLLKIVHEIGDDLR